MGRLIDADKFILALMDASLSSVDEDTILDLIDSILTVDAIPVVRGRWIFGKDLPEHIGAHPKNKWHLFCSCCHHQALNLSADNDDTQDVETDFCPWCGASMTEDNNEQKGTEA